MALSVMPYNYAVFKKCKTGWLNVSAGGAIAPGGNFDYINDKFSKKV